MISVKTKGLSKAIRDIKKWEESKKRAVRDAFNGASIDVERNAKQAAPVDMGRLRADIQREVTVSDEGAVVDARIVNSVQYAPFVEFGTLSNVELPPDLADVAIQFDRSKFGSFGELLENIQGWAARKGLPPESAYPIARKIARQGVSAQPYLYPAWQRERPKLVRELTEALRS